MITAVWPFVLIISLTGLRDAQWLSKADFQAYPGELQRHDTAKYFWFLALSSVVLSGSHKGSSFSSTLPFCQDVSVLKPAYYGLNPLKF